MPGLRDTLDAATPDWKLMWRRFDDPDSSSFDLDLYVNGSWEATLSEPVARLAVLAPELAALCLAFGEYLQAQVDDLARDDFYDDTDTRDALLARLDRIGKEPNDE